MMGCHPLKSSAEFFVCRVLSVGCILAFLISGEKRTQARQNTQKSPQYMPGINGHIAHFFVKH